MKNAINAAQREQARLAKICNNQAEVVRLHDEPQVAADVLKQAGLANVDCSKLDDYDKESLCVINTIPGVPLTGLDE